MIAFVGHTGRRSINLVHSLLKVCVLIVDTLRWTFLAPLRGKGLRLKSAVEHFVEYGYRSVTVVVLICFLVGATMAMQAAYQLAKLGADILVAYLVGIAATREFAPLMTAIVITGRSGSAITAEIGTMKVSEEIDALKVMGLNPIKFLVVPKFLGMFFAVPMVTLIGMFAMMFGGYALSVYALHMDGTTYIAQTADSILVKDFAIGIGKSFLFALVIIWVGVYRGFQVHGGAEGVGRQTTSSVVTSIFLIIIVDVIFTALFYSIG